MWFILLYSLNTRKYFNVMIINGSKNMLWEERGQTSKAKLRFKKKCIAHTKGPPYIMPPQ